MRFALSGLLALPAAVAAAERVAPLVPRIEPSAPPEVVERFHGSVGQGLANAGLDSLPAEDVASKLMSAGLDACEAGPCLARAGELLGARRFVATRVGQKGKNYEFELTLLESGGAAVAQVRERCDICTLSEAAQTAARAATELGKRSRTASIVAVPLPPVVDAEEPDAPRPIPVAPAVPVAGPAAPVAAPPPSAPSPMAPIPEPDAAVTLPPPPPAGGSGFLALAVGGWVAGTAAIIGGYYLVSIHGDPSCESDDPDFDPVTECPEVFDTGGAGAVLMGAGGAAVLGGFMAFHHHRHGPRAGVAPVSGGAVLGGSVSF